MDENNVAETAMVKAADTLRVAAQSRGEAAAFLIASAVATSMLRGEPAKAGESPDERHMRLLRAAADLLSPICPHCGKRITDSAGEQRGDV